MPKGKGTYGSKVGRPPKKAKGYQQGGVVEMNNPLLPDDMQNFAAGGIIDAMSRSQNIQGYGDGGEVSSKDKARKVTVVETGTGGTTTKTLTGEDAKKASEADKARRARNLARTKKKIKDSRAKKAAKDTLSTKAKKKASKSRMDSMFDDMD